MLFLLATSIYQEIDIMETQLNWKNMLQVLKITIYNFTPALDLVMITHKLLFHNLYT